MKKYSTSQEEFWAGEFGDEYIERNCGEDLLASCIAFWVRVLRHCRSVNSICELGANIGINLRSLKILLPRCKLAGVEINSKAAFELRKWGGAEVFEQSLFGFSAEREYDLTFTKGVLIHLNPDLLVKAYDILYYSSKRFVCVAEYYNPSPVEVTYRGNTEKLFKRDFAGEMLDRFPNLRLIDYGFAYHRDVFSPQDDISWFLMEKYN
jgi:spore coat polysaccharide biosynthesis protein SpsF